MDQEFVAINIRSEELLDPIDYVVDQALIEKHRTLATLAKGQEVILYPYRFTATKYSVLLGDYGEKSYVDDAGEFWKTLQEYLDFTGLNATLEYKNRSTNQWESVSIERLIWSTYLLEKIADELSERRIYRIERRILSVEEKPKWSEYIAAIVALPLPIS
jgi:hypothetical protein